MYVKMTQKMEKKKGFSRKHRLSPLSQSDESGNEMLKSWVNVKGGEKRSESHRGMTGWGYPGKSGQIKDNLAVNTGQYRDNAGK